MLIGLDAEEPRHELAWTVDSALWLVTVRVREDRTSVEQVHPLPIVNYRNERGEIMIDTMTGVAGRDLAEPWRRFYRDRAALVHCSFYEGRDEQGTARVALNVP
jgi:hypothetical protein